MSIAGRRLPTHYVSRDDLPGPDGHFPEPEVNVTLRMEHATAAYLCGHQKSGLERLQTFTGARFKVGYDTVDIRGLPEQVELARFCIDITLQQRRESRAGPLRFEEIERRPDVSTLDVPVETVGYVLGTRGASLRKHEAQNHVFMFFDNDRIRPGGPQGVRTKRLYIVGARRARAAATEACADAAFSRADTSRVVGLPEHANLPGAPPPPPPPRSPPRRRERSRSPSGRHEPGRSARCDGDDGEGADDRNYDDDSSAERLAPRPPLPLRPSEYIPSYEVVGDKRLARQHDDFSHHSVAHRAARGDFVLNGTDEFGRQLPVATVHVAGRGAVAVADLVEGRGRGGGGGGGSGTREDGGGWWPRPRGSGDAASSSDGATTSAESQGGTSLASSATRSEAPAAARPLSLQEQVSRAVEAHAKAALPALFEAHRLCWDEAAVGKMLCAAASQIHASVAGRGETSYRVALPDGRPHTVRLAALDRYLRKVVQARAERLAGAI